MKSLLVKTSGGDTKYGKSSDTNKGTITKTGE